VYVPRDEQFSDIKGRTFSATTLRSGLHAILPAIAPLLNNSTCFSHFPAIDALYSDGIPLPVDTGTSFNVINDVIPRVVQMIEDTTDHVLRFEVPHMVESEHHRRPPLLELVTQAITDHHIRTWHGFAGDRFSWFRDEEFARQTLAGLNPICIRLLTVTN
jgi:lipoxygenase